MFLQDAAVRAERRAHDVCPYEIVPSSQNARAIGEDKVEKPKLPGYLGTYGVDCKEVTFIQNQASLWLLDAQCCLLYLPFFPLLASFIQ